MGFKIYKRLEMRAIFAMGSVPYIAAKISGFLHDEVFRLAALSATSGISLPLKCDDSLVPSTSGLPSFEP
ncbi:hypothetical protein V500_04561, partial [Pseudogymnoascus sp. VKM F-4518 (FW-2643)]